MEAFYLENEGRRKPNGHAEVERQKEFGIPLQT
jgi:hypothetical protein